MLALGIDQGVWTTKLHIGKVKIYREIWICLPIFITQIEQLYLNKLAEWKNSKITDPLSYIVQAPESHILA